jgi:hypothetical protein
MYVFLKPLNLICKGNLIFWFIQELGEKTKIKGKSFTNTPKTAEKTQ